MNLTKAAIIAGLVLVGGVPNCPLMPADMLTAMLIACAMPSRSNPIRRATAAAVPMQPIVEVACQPAV